MSNNRILLYALFVATIVACSSTPLGPISDTIPDGVRRLMEAYPEHVVGYEDNHIIFSDSSRMIFDDGIKRSIIEMHEEQDVEEIFFQDYDKTIFPPPYGYDPGRYRCAAFFGKIYGDTPEKVIENLVEVEWCPSLGGNPVLFTTVAGAAEALKRVSEELDKHPEFKSWVVGARTFNWRTILGMTRLSPHGYGIAIDLASWKSHYWKWSYPQAKEHTPMKYINTFEMKIVEIFERHGFIWGGRWYHFDTMHFEYRPEMNPPVDGPSKPRTTIYANPIDPELEQELYYNVFKTHKRGAYSSNIGAEPYFE